MLNIYFARSFFEDIEVKCFFANVSIFYSIFSKESWKGFQHIGMLI